MTTSKAVGGFDLVIEQPSGYEPRVVFDNQRTRPAHVVKQTSLTLEVA